jgi:RecA/RadA recombinase
MAKKNVTPKTSLETSSKVLVNKKKIVSDDLESIMEEMSEFKKDIVDYSNGKGTAPLYHVHFKNKALNKITGGVSAGYFLELIGESQAGKSFLIYELMAECEKMGGYCLLADLERALEDSYWGIVGLTPKRTVLTYQNRIEKLFPIFVKYIKSVRKKNKTCPIVLAVDSYAVLKTIKEQEDFEAGTENEKKGYADMRRATVFYAQLETFLQLIDDENVVFVLANQMRIDYQVMFGDKKTSRGEKVLKYWAHMRIRGELKQVHKRKVETLEKEKFVKVGVDTEWTTLKNRGVTPFKTAKTSIMYKTGVNPWSGLEEVLLNEGSITIHSRPAKVKKAEKETMTEKLERERLQKIFTFKVKGDSSEKIYENAKQICEDFPKLLLPKLTGDDEEEGEVYAEDVVSEGELADEDLE